MRTLFVLLVVLCTVTAPAAGIESIDVRRGASISISDDMNGLVPIDTADQVVQLAGTVNIDRLTTITNTFGTDLTVTVTLREDTAHKANLETDGNTSTSEGNVSTFTIAGGASKDVDIRLQEQASGFLYFHVMVTKRGFSYEAVDRETDIVQA